MKQKKWTSGTKVEHVMRNRSYAFTLVELLVVIGIIALLIGILLPTLKKVQIQARETKCMSNMRQMVLGFHMYTNENRGKFPMHVVTLMNQARHSGLYLSHIKEQSLYDRMRSRFIKDGWLTICPFYAARDNTLKNPYYWSGTGNASGGWEYYRETTANPNSPPIIIQTAYTFFPNLNLILNTKDTSPDGLTKYAPITFNSATGDTPWPRVAKDAKSRAPMIAHTLAFNDNGSNTDNGHQAVASQFAYSGRPTVWNQLRTKTSPVAYGDGHVELNRRDSIRLRATFVTSANFGNQDVWY